MIFALLKICSPEVTIHVASILAGRVAPRAPWIGTTAATANDFHRLEYVPPAYRFGPARAERRALTFNPAFAWIPPGI